MDSEIIPESAPIRDEDSFKILVASDIHLGYSDNNPAREDDSFITFEEILQIGRDEKVDFVLLGGDLFHENRPKPDCLRKTIEIMRKYCLGSKAIEFEYLGDPAVDFPNQEEPEVNYQNPDINIAMPVFTIHGNHDDPIGMSKSSAVDHLVAAKLLNHFGQWNDLNEVTVKPVPLVKGETKLALYGLGNIKDQRLFRLLRDQKVTFVRPKESQTDWFNIFVLHQNRTKHEAKNYVPEGYLPGFMDLAIWGHEHECRIDPEPADAGIKTFIIQPGSSVGTSLCAGEAVEKFVGILHVNRKKFRLEKKKLRTVRPFIFADIQLKDVVSNMSEEKEASTIAEKYVEARVNELVRDAEELLTGHEQQPILPLIRVRVFHDLPRRNIFNEVRFSQKFAGIIANEDVILFKKMSTGRTGTDDMDMDEMEGLFRDQQDDDLDSHVEKIVEAFFVQARENGDHANILELLSERGLSEAVKSSVEKNDKLALSVVIESQMERVMEYLMKKNVNEDTILEELDKFRALRLAQADQESAEVTELLRKRPRNVQNGGSGSEEEGGAGSDDENDNEEGSMIDDDEDDMPVPAKRGSRGGRGGARGGRGRGGRGRGKTSGNDSSLSPPKRRGRGRGAAAPAANSSRSRARDISPPDVKPKKNMLQTTLQVRRSPRKTRGAMTFDVSDSD